MTTVWGCAVAHMIRKGCNCVVSGREVWTGVQMCNSQNKGLCYKSNSILQSMLGSIACSHVIQTLDTAMLCPLLGGHIGITANVTQHLHSQPQQLLFTGWLLSPALHYNSHSPRLLMVLLSHPSWRTALSCLGLDQIYGISQIATPIPCRVTRPSPCPATRPSQGARD